MNFLLINKPTDWTSFDVVNYIRRKERLRTGIKNIKVGHAGTLDPFATGLLIVGVGREATKRLDEFKKLPKTYVATLHLGAVSDTYDSTGRIEVTLQQHNTTAAQHSSPTTGHINNETMKQFSNLTPPTRTAIESVLNSFLGKQLQIPPMFSAKKVNGQRLYKLARQGQVVERVPSEIEIYDIRIKGYEYPLLKIEVECSSGTYIRSLAHDIGQKLKIAPRPGSGRSLDSLRSLAIGAYCEELVRTKIGDYTLDKAKDIDEIKNNNIL